MTTYAPLWPSTSQSTLLSPFPRGCRPFTWLALPKPQQVLSKRLSNSRASCIFWNNSERFGVLSTKGNCNKDGAVETKKTGEKLKGTQSEPVLSNETDEIEEKLRSAQLEQSKPRKMEKAKEKSTSTPLEPVSSNKTEKTQKKLMITLLEPVKSKKMETAEEEKP